MPLLVASTNPFPVMTMMSVHLTLATPMQDVNTQQFLVINARILSLSFVPTNLVSLHLALQAMEHAKMSLTTVMMEILAL